MMKGTALNGFSLVVIGYRYSTRTLVFIATMDAELTTPGKAYLVKYTDDYGNVCACLVECPDIISKLFQDSSTMDEHSQSWQFDLTLEKTWLT